MPHPRATQSDVLSAVAMSFTSLARGMMLDDSETASRQAGSLRLYDIENCPECRLVRERLCELQQDVEIRPVPDGGVAYTVELEELVGAGVRAPVLHDVDSDAIFVGAHDALQYLGKAGTTGLSRWTSRLSSKLRSGKGERVDARVTSPVAEHPKLTLYSFEASPYCRLVRERLCELELTYTCYQMPRDSWADVGPAELRLGGNNWEPTPGSRREKMLREYGKVQVPFLLVDEGAEQIFGTSKIIARVESLAGL